MKTLSCLFLLFLLSMPLYAFETYKFDPNHTQVEWQANHFGFSNPSGKWYVTGTLQLDENDLKNSKVAITIPMNNLITGIPKFDDHLKSAEFFDVKRFPTATFYSDEITTTGKTTAKIHGVLTLHGVSNPVILDVKLNKQGMNMQNKKTLGFTATTKIKRSDWGLTAFLPGVSDQVNLHIEAEANLQ